MKDGSRTPASKSRARNGDRVVVKEMVGIDLGNKVSQYAILSAAGELIEEDKFRNQVSSIEKALWRKHGARAGGAGSGGAIGLDRAGVETAGTRGDRGASARAGLDHLGRR